MTNVTTSTTTTNPFFLEEAGEYLEENGYTRGHGKIVSDTIYFFNGKHAVVIYDDRVEFQIYDDGETEQRRAGYSKYMSFAGIGDLDLSKWMLLLHIADIVPMKDFISTEKKEAAVSSSQLNDVFVQIFDRFGIANNRNAVLINH
jgi:hypothetical protein